MAKLKMFSVYDSKVVSWMSPMFAPTIGHGERIWQEICSDAGTMCAKYPDDFNLYLIGEFDDESGSVVTQAPQFIMSGIVASGKAQSGDAVDVK